MGLKPTSETLSVVYETLRRTVQGSRNDRGAFEPGPQDAAEDDRNEVRAGESDGRPADGSGRGDKLDIKI